jgi:hypothetical protein
MITVDSESPSRETVAPLLNKRLLHVIRSISPAAGGPTVGIRTLAEASAGGPQMELVCLDNPAESFVQNQPFLVHALGPSDGHYGYTPRLATWLRENLSRFDGVVIHGLWQYHSYGSYRVIRGRVPMPSFPMACSTPISGGHSR